MNSRINARIEKYSPNIFDESPIERDQLVYVPRFLCQASLPKKLEDSSEWRRSFRNHDFSILSPSNIGIPGGAYSRLILIKLTTLAKFQETPEIYIGRNCSEFMQELGLIPTGGIHGTINRFKEHFIRCLNCVIHTQYQNGPKVEYSISPIIETATVTDICDWNWESKIRLSQPFFKESQTAAPTDIGALKCLMPGTLRMDVFIFLVWRLYYLKKTTIIPWSELYAMHASPGVSNKRFRQSFKIALIEAKCFYSQANVETNDKGIVLRRSQRLIP